MTKEIKVEIKNYTLEDYRLANQLYWNHAKGRYLFWVAGLFFLWSAWLSFSNPSESFIVAFFQLLVALFFLLYKQVILPLMAKQMFKKSALQKEVPIKAIFSPREIRLVTGFGKYNFFWRRYEKYFVSSKILVLQQSPRAIFFIPRRCISSEADWTRLVALCNQNIH